MDSRKYFRALVSVLATAGYALGANALEYDAVDITDWSIQQLATVPFFRHFVPAPPPGAPDDMVCEAQNTAGDVVGWDPVGSVYLQEVGNFVAAGTSEVVTPLGSYYWEYIYWDGDDYHFQNGFVQFSALFDVNSGGLAVGTSTVDGRGDAWNGYGSSALLVNAPGKSTTVLSEGYERGEARGINDSGEITGWVSAIAGATSAFRRGSDGILQLLDGLFASSGNAINSDGLIVGATSFQSHYTRAFVSKSGTQTTLLKVPKTENADNSAAYDINNKKWIVGSSWQGGQPYEHFAALWKYNRKKGRWKAYDLNELRITPDILLENANAINDDGAIIATGRPDGSDAFGSRTYLLTPK